jgi:hypothetical protein
MKTGFRGTFVISWSQTEIDGLWSAPMDTLRVGTGWQWTGEAVRVDGPSGVLPLGDATGSADLRKRAALSVRRLLRAVEADVSRLDEVVLDDPLFDIHFVVTDGRNTWTVTILGVQGGKAPLLMFHGEIPPRATDLWVVSHNIDLAAQETAKAHPGGVICFTPGTMIETQDGPRRVEDLREGNLIQTTDNGCVELLWKGRRRISGARLHAMPDLAPVRMRAGALDEGVPDAGLLVSPDHRIVLSGAQARAPFNADEVLVMARDLVNDHSIMVDRQIREVEYYHLLLPSHEVVFANRVETESFHPAAADLTTIDPMELQRLYERMPELVGDPFAYGHHARRILSASEAAVLQYDTGRRAFLM